MVAVSGVGRALWCGMVGVACAAGAARGQCQLLAPAVSYATTGAPQWIAVGDLNGDGIPDVVAAGGTMSVLVLLGTPQGTLGPATAFSAGVIVKRLVLADMDSDGRLDVIATTGVNTVVIMHGDGMGGFGAATSYSTGTNPMGVAVGDVNGDGKLDIAIANYGSNTVSVLETNVTGAFGSLALLSVGGDPNGVVLADFNGDGKLDVATANTASPSVSVLLGSGTGGFSAVPNLPTFGGATALAAADLNRDGKVDLVVATSSGDVRVMFGTGTGSFAAPVSVGGSSAVAVAIADMNRDGTLDVIAGNRVIPGVGTGAFRDGIAWPTVVGAYGIATTDLNRDGLPDVIIATGNGVAVLLGVPPAPPVITQQPVFASGFVGSEVFFRVVVQPGVGAATPMYQWRRNGVPINGAFGPVLSRNSVALMDNGSTYDCVVSNACGSVRSDPAGLAVTARCPADFDGVDGVTVADVFAFFDAWFAGCP